MERSSILILLASCPKHVEFYSKNKFEKSVHLVGFIIGIHQNVSNLYIANKNVLFSVSTL